jgi:DNA-directed RNA polymerase subunit RPC12/RpoP
MPTLDSIATRTGPARRRPEGGHVAAALLALGATLLFLAGGCSKDPALDAIETDANGYFCLKCQAKLYTERKVFLENCPRCGENALVNVVGYWCEKDHHLTLRPQVSGPQGAAVCETCGAPLKNAMVSPREKDLRAWGAAKTTLKR